MCALIVILVDGDEAGGGSALRPVMDVISVRIKTMDLKSNS